MKDHKQAMDTIMLNHYNIVKIVSSLAGQWPYQKLKTRLFCVGLITLSALSINVSQMARFVMRDLTNHLFIDWNTLETSEEYKIIARYAENGKRYSLGYSLYCCFAVCVFMSVSLIPQVLDIILPLNKSRPILLTYPGHYFVDEREYFFYIFLHAVVAWEIVISGIIAHDCIFVTYIEHVCSMFNVVGSRFERLFCNHNNEATKFINTDNTDNTYCKKIALIVHAHRNALRYAQLLEDTFTVPFAMQILLVTIALSITLLQMVQQDDSSNILQTIRYTLYVFGQLIHLFFLSFEGQKLIDHSLQIREKIYNSCWYKVSVKSQKLITLVMIKSLRLSYLSAGKIYIFSLESFTTVLQTSMSYCTVLASFQ
ncbi:odorant receptor 13a-like isoform X2 [Cardiocondyla obscurior]|uniref:odorant receptor 13a-like isoform X2 n=1 Tax=Cardiocondyla obscurior TaxID=286306 RepID=UPI00396583E4